MTTGCHDVIFLSGPVPDAGPDLTTGKLDLRQTRPQRKGAFQVLDCFDGSIRKAGRLLIWAEGRLNLYLPDGRVLEQPLDGPAPAFVADLPDGPVKHALHKVSPLRSLIPLGTGVLSVRDLAVVDDEEKTQARGTLRTLRPNGAGSAVTAAVIVGLRGYDKAFDALSGGLRRLATTDRLDVDHAVDTLFPARAAYDAKPDVPVGPGDTAFDAANRIIGAYLPVVRANEPGIIADHDTEFLHDYRVALRKIRSVISLFRGVYSESQTAALKAEFSDLMAVTGRLRDLDVYLLDRDTYFALLPDTLRPGLAMMFDGFAAERTAAHKAMIRHLRSKAYRDRIARLEALFARPDLLPRGPDADRPAMGYASDLIWRRYRQVCKIASGIGADTPDDDVHELRIRCKKLRYLMEFFGALYPERDMARLIKPLKGLQNNLGYFNDYSVQQESLQAYLDQMPVRASKRTLEQAKSIGALIAALHDRQVAERARVVSNFEAFDSPEIRQTFRDLFKTQKA
jgi:CHAD domain-containing protein